MNSWKESLHDFLKEESDKPEFIENALQNIIVKGMEDGEITLTSFVEELGFHLMASDVSKRVQATTLLSGVISKLPKDFLNEAEVCHLLEYYFARLLDHHNLIPSILTGLQALTTCDHFPPNQAYPVFNQVTLNTSIPTLLSKERYSVYSLVAHLLRSYLPNLLENDAAFVQGFIQMMDGERDPRCLLLLFSITPLVLKKFHIDLFVEEFFEVLSCYFPVDFSPPPNDSIGITREDLADGLERCLLGNAKFAHLTIPLILEKIESNLENAKIDSLKLLLKGFKEYPPSSFEDHISEIWPHLRTEIFLGHSKLIQELSLDCISHLVSTAHHLCDPQNTIQYKQYGENEKLLPFKVLLLDIWQDCKQFIIGSDIKHLQAALSVMRRLLQSSYIGAKFFEEDLFHLILENYNTKNQIALKEVLLENVAGLLVAATGEGQHSNLVVPYGFNIKNFFTTILETEKNPSLLTAALKGAYQVYSIEELDDPYWEMTFMQSLYALVESDNEAFRPTLIEILSKVDAQNSQNESPAEYFIFSPVMKKLKALISEETISNTNPYPNSEDELYDKDPYEPYDPPDDKDIPKYFSILTAIKHRPEKVVPFVLEFLLKSCHEEPSRAEHAASCLLELATVPSSFLSESLVPLMSLCINAEKPLSPSLLNKCYRILELALRCQSIEIMKPILQDLVLLFLHQDTVASHLLQAPSVSLHSLVPLLQIILANISLDIEVPQKKELILKFVEIATSQKDDSSNCNDNNLVLLACHCGSLLLNKAPESEVQDLSAAVLLCLRPITEKSSPSSVLVWIWLAKALIIRNHPYAEQFIAKLIEWLESPELGSHAAEGFATILQDYPDVFVPSFSNTRMLFRHKFFVQTSGKLLDGYYSCPNDAVKSNYLLALTHELRYAPQAAVLQDIEKFLPVLLQAFDNTGTDSNRHQEQATYNLQCSLLNTMKQMLSHSPRLLEDHLHSFVPRLLALLSTSFPLQVRRTALQCILQLCSSMKPHLLLPLRRQVIGQLTCMLNDPKRVVRKEAVNARNSWILVGQPSS